MVQQCVTDPAWYVKKIRATNGEENHELSADSAVVQRIILRSVAIEAGWTDNQEKCDLKYSVVFCKRHTM